MNSLEGNAPGNIIIPLSRALLIYSEGHGATLNALKSFRKLGNIIIIKRIIKRMSQYRLRAAG